MFNKRKNKLMSLLICLGMFVTNIPAFATQVVADNGLVLSPIIPTNELEEIDLSADASTPSVTTEDLQAIVDSERPYSALSSIEKKPLLGEYRVQDSVMTMLETAGYNLSDSIDLSKILQNTDLTVEQFEEMVVNFGDRETALEEAETFANYRYTHSSIQMETDSVCIDYLVSGIPAKNILKARAMAYLLDMDMRDICDFNNSESTRNDELGQFAAQFCVLISVLEEYLAANDLTLDAFNELAAEKIGSVLMETGDAPMPMLVGGSEGGYEPEVYPLAPYGYTSRGTERINEQTGSVGYLETDAMLPGKNGLDLNIGVRYESANSSDSILTCRTSVLPSGRSVRNFALKRKLYSPLVSFAAGWDFTMSHIRYYKQSFDDIYSAVVLADGSVRSIYIRDLQNKDKEEITLDDGNIAIYNVRLFKDSSYEDNGVTSMFCLQYADGRKEYFDNCGRIMKTKNRFDDQIIYRYFETGAESETFEQHYNRVEITDTLGQLTTIEITAEEIHQDNMGNDIPTQQMIVTLPDGATIVYQLRGVWRSETGKIHIELVDSKTNQEGMTTCFKYIEDDVSKFNFIKGFSEAGRHAFYPMTRIIHPTGLVTEYSYEHYAGALILKGDTFDYYRLLERKDTDGINEYNTEIYSYYLDYSYWDKYHTVTVTNADGLSTERYFTRFGPSSGYYRLKTYERAYYKDGQNEINVSRTEYDDYFERTYPQSITHYIYSEDGTKSTDTTVKYEYNEYGNCVKYWDAHAGGDKTNTEHMTTYTYDSEYQYLTEKTYKRDENTTIREVYTPSEDHKNILEESTYMNDALVSKTSFTYGVNSSKPSSATIHRSITTGDSVTMQYQYYNNTFKSQEMINGDSTSYTYDIYGHLLTQTDPNGNVTSYTYDNLGRQTSVSYPDGTSTSTLYQLKDSTGNVINRVTVTAQNGHQTVYNYDELGQLKNIKDLTLNFTEREHEYDGLGRITKVTLADGVFTTYSYDIKGRIVSESVRESDGTVTAQTSYEYENVYDTETSKVVTINGSVGAEVKTAQYTDKYGNMVREDLGDTGNLSESKQYTYDYLGNQVSELYRASENAADQTRSSVSITANASQGTLQTVTDYYNHQSKSYLNMAGQEKDVVDGNGNHVWYGYDASGRLATKTVTIDGGSSITSYTYDGNGNVLKESVTDNKPGQATTRRNTYKAYDSMNRVIRIWSDEEGETRYTYDAMGNISTMIVGITPDLSQGQTTTYSYDSRNRLVKTTDALGQVETYSYDARDNLIGSTDRNGAVSVNTYNGNGQILTNRVSYQGESDVIEYGYNTAGLLESMSDGHSSVGYFYNAKGQTVTENLSGETTATKTYTYDKDGNPSGIQITTGSTVYSESYSYNPAGQLTKVQDNIKGADVASYAYDAAGNIKTLTRGNGVQTEYTYNQANALSGLTNKRGNTVLSSYSYSYYLDGNRAEVVQNNGRVQSFTYDKLGRLVKETDSAAGNTTTYTYDRFSNRAGMTVSGNKASQSTYTYDGNNRLTKSQKTTGGTTEIQDYNYDANGNMILKLRSRLEPDNGESAELMLKAWKASNAETESESGDIAEAWATSYTYNARGQMTGVVTDNGLTAAYRYDVTGYRSGKTVNGKSSSYIWSGDNLVYESGAETRRYSYGLGRIGMANGTEMSYYLYNGHGDTTQLTDGSGVVQADYAYDAFGNEQGEEPNIYNPFRYTGEYLDEETGFIYLRNRYYNPATGRFLTEDPAKDGLNWYVYCNNNPVNFVDPWGLAITEEDRRAYEEGRISEYHWNILLEADYKWQMALADDYSAKAEAHLTATNIRRLYNLDLIDDFDYTFGTGASALDSGECGNYVKTASYQMSDGSGGVSTIYYTRFQIHERAYIRLTQVGARSFSGRRYQYDGIVVKAGIVLSLYDASVAGWSNDNYVNETVDYGAFPDANGTVFLDGGATTEFYFTSGKTFTITNNVYETNWTDEYGTNYYINPIDLRDMGLSGRNQHYSSGR